MEGVRVVQVTGGPVGSAAASVLAAWGADVIDASPRAGLSGQRQLRGLRRRIFVDMAREEGYTVLLELVTGADVFLTDLEDDVRRGLRIDLPDLGTVNPELVYARCPAAPASSAEDLEAVAIAGAVAAGLLRGERTGGLQLVEWPMVGHIWADGKELESVNLDRDQRGRDPRGGRVSTGIRLLASGREVRSANGCSAFYVGDTNVRNANS